MRTHRLIVALSLLLGACGGPATEEPPQAPPADLAEPAVQLPAGGLFAYAYEPGSTYTYSFEMRQHLDVEMTAEGSDSLFEGEEPPPGHVDADVLVSGLLTYDVARGSDPDTYEITITGSLEDLQVSGTVDGTPIEDEQALADTGAPDLVEMPNVRLVIDSHGNLLEADVDGEEIPDLSLLDDPFAGFQNVMSGGLNGHFGPAFPVGPLSVGDTWGDSIERDVLDQSFTTDVTYTVAGIEESEGGSLAVINQTMDSSGLTIDFGQFFAALFEGFEGAEGAEAPELDFSFVISLDPATASGTVWFDPVAGVTDRYRQDTEATMSMDFSMDDGEQSGEVHMDMSFDISVDAELTA